MPQDRAIPTFGSSSSSNVRKPDKKRKHASSASSASVSTEKKVKDASRLQLDDILSTLTSGTVKQKGKEREREEDAMRVRKKVKQDPVASGKGKGAPVKGKEKDGVSALDLLMGLGGRSVKDSMPVKKKKKLNDVALDHGVRESNKKIKVGGLDEISVLRKQAEGAEHKMKVKGKSKDDTAPNSATASKERSPTESSTEPAVVRKSSPPTNGATPRTTYSSAQSPMSFTKPSPAGSVSSANTDATPLPAKSPSTAPAPSIASPTLDAPLLLKNFKTHLRTLISALSALTTELTLIDRIWYKNASQFKSALWWGSFNGVRRGLHRMLLAPHGSSGSNCVDGERGDGEENHSLASDAVFNLTSLYAGLGGGLEALTSIRQTTSSGFPTIPKFDTRPSAPTLLEFLSSPPGRSHLASTLHQLTTFQTALQAARAKCSRAGETLVLHLNTPPAPTFAPLVTALLALVASVDAELAKAVGGRVGGEEDKVGEASVGELLKLIRGLPQV